MANAQRQLEETIQKINSEQDPEKRMKLLQVNLFRRKSLLRIERPQPAYSSQNPLEEDKSSSSFAGQKQALSDQYLAGSSRLHGILQAPYGEDSPVRGNVSSSDTTLAAATNIFGI
jgi:hypothetical protein